MPRASVTMHAVDRPGLSRRSRTAMRRSCRKVRMLRQRQELRRETGEIPADFARLRFHVAGYGTSAPASAKLWGQALKPLLHEVLFAAALPGLRFDQAAGGHHVDRARIVEALRVLAAKRAEFRGLFGGLDALGHDVHAEVVREADDGSHHFDAVAV